MTGTFDADALKNAGPEAYEAIWRPSPSFVGPVMPPMIAAQRAGEPGWPFHWSGGPLPGTIDYPKAGEQFDFQFGAPTTSNPIFQEAAE